MTLKLDFICTRILEWCSQQNIGSSSRIQLPLENTGKTWMGFALFAVFLIQEDDNLYLEEAYFHFETDKGYLGNEHYVMEHPQISRAAGSYGVCIFVPQTK